MAVVYDKNDMEPFQVYSEVYFQEGKNFVPRYTPVFASVETGVKPKRYVYKLPSYNPWQPIIDGAFTYLNAVNEINKYKSENPDLVNEIGGKKRTKKTKRATRKSSRKNKRKTSRR